MNDDNSLYCSLGDKLTPSSGQVVPLNWQSDHVEDWLYGGMKLIWKNPAKKQSRKKYWANLRLVKGSRVRRDPGRAA